MGRRDRAWPHHLGSLTGFCSARPQARKKFTHDAAFISGCPVSAPDPVYEIAGKCARPPRNDSEKTVDSFCPDSNDRASDRLGLISGLPRPNAGLEQFQNTSP